ncbi:hypothetical protein FACS1894181_03470 [Bacteroidia bacterium]|nr:hypothetical protein FACS1894181_03470 [Bacteroidia bacterium]
MVNNVFSQKKSVQLFGRVRYSVKHTHTHTHTHTQASRKARVIYSYFLIYTRKANLYFKEVKPFRVPAFHAHAMCGYLYSKFIINHYLVKYL